MPSRLSRTGERGFTLIEVLVALTILSISMVVLLAIFGRGLIVTRQNATQADARDLAQSLLAQALAVPHPAFGGTDGTSNGLHWHVEIAPYGSGDDQLAWKQAAQQVNATVWWMNGNNKRALTLSSLRLNVVAPPVEKDSN